MAIKTTGVDQLKYFYSKIKEKTVAKDEVATADSLGLVKPGDGLSVTDDGTLGFEITDEFVDKLLANETFIEKLSDKLPTLRID